MNLKDLQLACQSHPVLAQPWQELLELAYEYFGLLFQSGYQKIKGELNEQTLSARQQELAAISQRLQENLERFKQLCQAEGLAAPEITAENLRQQILSSS